MADLVWRFSDGTTVELGGKISGSTAFADTLREWFAHGARVVIWAEPSPSFDVDGFDPALLDAWLRHELMLWHQKHGAELTVSRPEHIPPLPPPPWGTDGGPGDPNVVY